MEDLLSKIYDKVVYYEQDCIRFGKEYDCKVGEIVEPLKTTMSESDVEAIKELIYNASYDAEKYGFMLGVRFIAKLIADAMGITG